MSRSPSEADTARPSQRVHDDFHDADLAPPATRFFKNSQLRRLDWSLLLVFAAIGHRRKLSSAATELGLSKSAISHALNRLREIFDDLLFVRELGGVRPTPRAATLLPKVMAIIRLSHEALTLNETFDPATASREFRIGAVEYVETVLGPELIRLCSAEAPNMRLNFIPTTRAGMLEAVASYKVDVGLGSFIGDSVGLDVESLLHDEYIVVHRANAHVGPPLSREAYLRAGHISITIENQPQRVIEGIMTQQGASRRIVALMPHYASAFLSLTRSDCLLTVPRLLAARLARELDLEIHPFPFPHDVQTISLLTPKLARQDPAIDWFKRKCAQAAAGAMEFGQP